MTIGIYSIYWEEQENSIYIGQSLDIENRRSHHLCQMKANKHRNFKIQQLYNKYGIPKHIILEQTTPALLLERECFWINEFNSIEEGLNLTHPEHVLNGFKAPNSKYPKIVLLQLFRLLRKSELSYQDISELTGVKKTTVVQISSKHKHIWMHEKYPNISQQVELARQQRLATKYDNKYIEYVVKDIVTNEVHKIQNISKFCKPRNLNIGNFHGMLNGRTNRCGNFCLIETAKAFKI